VSLVPLCVGLLGRERASTTSHVPTAVGRVRSPDRGSATTTLFNTHDYTSVWTPGYRWEALKPCGVCLEVRQSERRSGSDMPRKWDDLNVIYMRTCVCLFFYFFYIYRYIYTYMNIFIYIRSSKFYIFFFFLNRYSTKAISSKQKLVFRKECNTPMFLFKINTCIYNSSPLFR
jgi:hypothetical protein